MVLAGVNQGLGAVFVGCQFKSLSGTGNADGEETGTTEEDSITLSFTSGLELAGSLDGAGTTGRTGSAPDGWESAEAEFVGRNTTEGRFAEFAPCIEGGVVSAGAWGNGTLGIAGVKGDV